MVARTRWSVPDAMIPAESTGGLTSHESVCVLNPGDADASLVFTAYYADAEPEVSDPVRLPARRSAHLRTDDPGAIGGLTIPTGVPYALVVEADRPIDVQYSRLDTTQAAYALMTVIPPAEEVARHVG
ncbi:sensory rhodopsin transducer [Rhizohabitans arisaemae]|uniref:sensory rhodopsin transducer n=1 Tax=Rhizohabitans arisaemae TaxID=2720610 RepID=UPI0024B130C9|nr:sensory rhodopsin transducer [Rhizohabitans arisaemae]